MKYSVVIPCFNSMSTIEQALLSVRRQIGPQDCEIVMVSDETAVVARFTEYDRLCDKYKAILCTTDGGVGVCRTTNLGILSVTGEFVHVLHPDDWVLDGFYATMNALSSHHTGRALYCSWHLQCDEHGLARRITPVDYVLPHPLLHCGNPFATSACIVRRDAYLLHGFWDEGLRCTADWELFVRMAAQGGYATYHLPLAAYRGAVDGTASEYTRAAGNLREHLQFLDTVSRYSRIDRPMFLEFLKAKTADQAKRMHAAQDLEAASASANFLLELQETKCSRS